ncbi:MAG: hypothetical protein JSV94_03500 [Methanobacteriota archaeon]|nr:MAG: hypothetical protein JSV94_03500 [Euryarchaeota archaeon]
MATSVEDSRLLTKTALENYARAYFGAFMNAVDKERPEHVPALARNSPYEIEVCLMPNQCFAMLFEKADRQKITVRETDWAYAEDKARTGVSHMVVVYAHENPTVADAIAKGKKDAIRSIRVLEDSSLAKAVTQLEDILSELTNVEKGNKSLLRLAELEMARLEPIKNVVMNSGPEVDMLAMIDSLRNYPSEPVEISFDVKERNLLEEISRDLGNLNDVIRKVESQDETLERLELSMKKSLGEFHGMIDEKIDNGLAVLMSSSDKKVERFIAAAQKPAVAEVAGDEIAALKDRLSLLEMNLQNAQTKRVDVSKELVLAVAELRDNLDRLDVRISRLEQKTAVSPASMHYRRLSADK